MGRCAKRIAGLVFLAALLQGSFTSAFACECDSAPPPCRALWQADTVFVGRADNVEFVQAPPPQYDHYRVTFSVARVLNGGPIGQLIIKTAASGAACGYEFRQGESYVVYGYKQRGELWTSQCGRTKPLSAADADLEYASSLGAPGATGSIFGRLNRWDDYPGPTDSRITKSLGGLANVPIVVEGPGGPFRTVSSEDGRFEVRGLREGSYRVALQLPETLMYRGATEPIRLANAHACERADFSVHFNGRISGTVIDAKGSPVVGANIALEPADLADKPSVMRHDRKAVTDRNGAFELVRIPPGEYVVGLNIDPHFENMRLGRGLPGRWVSPRVFHPGSGDPAAATRIILGEGEKRALPPLRLPDNVVVRPITGMARWPDGRPVSEGWVSLHDADIHIGISAIVRTSVTGEFEAAAFAGQRLFITVEAHDGDRRGHAESAPITVGLDTAPAPVAITVVVR